MNAITVCVQYDDLLSITLPWNAQHFEQILVVTSPGDQLTPGVVDMVPNATIFATDAFYRHGAAFNKGLALEQGFDVLGRDGWMCVFDADILLPRFIGRLSLKRGNLYCPRRRLVLEPSRWRPNDLWEQFPPFSGDAEHGGWCQMFHADDLMLANGPYYPIDWRHAGGSDSEFQAKWNRKNKVWLPFTVLHLGKPGQNWHGRYTARLDGTMPPEAEARAAAQDRMYRNRRKYGFALERLSRARRGL